MHHHPAPPDRPARHGNSVVGEVGCGGLVDEIFDEVFGDSAVADVAGRDFRGRDDLRVGINPDMTLVTIEAECRGLVAVAGGRSVGSTVEITRSFATRRAIRNIPLCSSWSKSWPSTVANNSAATRTSGSRSRPSTTPKQA